MSTMRFIRVLLAISAIFSSLILGSGPVAFAEFIPPDKIEVHTNSYEPRFLEIPQGSYSYSINWQGIPVANAEVTIESKKDAGARSNWEVLLRATSASVVSIFYTLEFSGRAVFRAESLRPSYFSTEQKENGRQSGREIIFHEDGTISSVRSRRGKPVETVSFNPHNNLFDPVSATFFIRSLALELGKEVAVDVYNSKHRYLISFLPSSIDEIAIGKEAYQAWNLVPTVTRLTDSEPEKRVRKVNIWLSADDRRLVLRLASEVWIGSVTANLVKYVPSLPPK